MGIGPEVATRPILERAWEEGKNVACPKVQWRPRDLVSFAVTRFDELREGRGGLLEPDPDGADPIEEAFDLILVPGLAFDPAGGRIGYGAGFYDRFLERTGGLKVALAYSLQVVEVVPVEPHDVPVDRILTEEESIDCTPHGVDGPENEEPA